MALQHPNEQIRFQALLQIENLLQQGKEIKLNEKEEEQAENGLLLRLFFAR
jgi:hypothetical protein